AGLKIAQELGMVDHIGISSHNLNVLEKAITCGEFDTVMLDYSAFYLETERLIALAKERDVGIIVMRPLGGSGRTSAIGSLMKASAGEYPLTPRILLRYVLSNPDISVAIPGVRYPSRVRENVELALTYQPLDESRKRECEAEARLLF
ncbi:MAG: aldo/keto reductase, partial [Dehalococcoidia bacterium]|nr:aldo/keto reductase [Dehalococcoidia bacterium]